jgi:hypothetical protein
MKRLGAVITLMAIAFSMVSADTVPATAQRGRTPLSRGRLEDLPVVAEVSVPFEAFRRYVRAAHTTIDPIYLRVVFGEYVRATESEGVSLIVALAQMIHETNYLRFTGAVAPTQYNFSGIGSTGPGVAGDRFPNVSTGVLAHVQHLRAYADTDPLVEDLVDPRFHLVERGSAPTVSQLTGRWATDPLYGQKVLAHAHRLLEVGRWYGQPLPPRR